MTGRSTAVNWVVRCEATHFSVAATNHCALGSDEMRPAEMRSDEQRRRDTTTVSQHRDEHGAVVGLGEDAVAMETARDYRRDAPLVVVPAWVPVEVAQLVHRVAAEVLVERRSRCPPPAPRQRRLASDRASTPAGQCG